jgi:hypothetical protein
MRVSLVGKFLFAALVGNLSPASVRQSGIVSFPLFQYTQAVACWAASLTFSNLQRFLMNFSSLKTAQRILQLQFLQTINITDLHRTKVPEKSLVRSLQ